MRCIRRALFFGALTQGTLAFLAIAGPDACTSIWSTEAGLRPCCRAASSARISRDGDCCEYGGVEDRDPGASTAAPIVPPATWARASVDPFVAPASARADGDLAIPERPPDRRMLEVTVLRI